MRYEVQGLFQAGRQEMQFTKIVDAASERLAREKVYSLIGSEHRQKRRAIEITSVTPMED